MPTAIQPSFGSFAPKHAHPSLNPVQSVVKFGQDAFLPQSIVTSNVTNEYRNSFNTAAQELPYAHLLSRLNQKNWFLVVAPAEDKKTTFELDPGMRRLTYRPNNEGYAAFAKDDLARGLAKLINHGALSNLPAGRKLSDTPEVRAIVAPNAHLLKLAVKNWLHQAQKRSGSDVGFDPKGSDFLESALTEFLLGNGEQKLADEKAKPEGVRNQAFIAMYEYAKTVLEPYK